WCRARREKLRIAERRTARVPNAQIDVDAMRLGRTRSGAGLQALALQPLADAIQTLQGEIVVLLEWNRETRGERARSPAREQAEELGLLGHVKVVEPLDRSGLGVLAAAGDRVDGLCRRLHILAVGIGKRCGMLVQR